MIEFLIYPVSAILKFWHLFLHSGLKIGASTSWFLSIFGLIFTVRSIVAPLSWMQMKSSRIAQLIRPQMKQIQVEFESRTDADAQKWKLEETKRVQKENNYNVLSGCLPALIQLPVFIGLYQVLIRMSKPAEGISGIEHRPIGFLNSQDISDFLSVRIYDVPLPAYINMTQQQFADLNANQNDVGNVILPLAIISSLFTAFNMVYSYRYNLLTTDYDSKISVGVNKMLLTFAVSVPIILVITALVSPLPFAIILYWFGGNLWTMVQFIVIAVLINRKYPITEEFEEMRESGKVEYEKRKVEEKAHKRFVRRKRLLSLLQPHRATSHLGEIKQAKTDRKELRLAASAEKRENAKKRKEAMKANRQREFEEKQQARLAARAEKAAKKKGLDTSATEAEPSQSETESSSETENTGKDQME